MNKERQDDTIKKHTNPSKDQSSGDCPKMVYSEKLNRMVESKETSIEAKLPTEYSLDFSAEEKITAKEREDNRAMFNRFVGDGGNSANPPPKHKKAPSGGKNALNQITVGDVVKKLYKTNPFYLISACLVLYASTRLFHTDNVFIDNLVFYCFFQ